MNCTNRQRYIINSIIILLCFYLPFSWLLVVGNCSWDYRLKYLKLWLLLPGLYSGIIFGNPADSNLAALVMGLFVIILFTILLLLSMVSRKCLILAICIALLVTIPTSITTYGLFRF